MSYPFRLPNYKHQQEEFDRHRDDDGRALLWAMRTGKTKAVLDAACYRYSDCRDVDGILVIAPNGVHVNWVRRQLPLHMWNCVDWKAHAYQASEAHKQSHSASLESVIGYHAGMAVLTINSESLRYDKVKAIIKRFLKKRRIFLVVDESHDFRSPGSKRTKTMRGLARHCRVRRILSGTAVSNSPLAAFSQFEIVEKEALGYALFEDFQKEYAVFGTKRTAGGKSYPVLESYQNLDKLQAKMAQWSSVVLREDVDDMPELLFDEVTVTLTEELHAHYRAMLKDYILELEDGTDIQALEGGVRLTKLQQITSGFVIDEAGNPRDLCDDAENPRLQALLRQTEGPTGKHIVWCKFQEDIKRAVRALRAAGLTCVEYHGKIHSQQRRQKAIDDFMHDPKVRVFVGQPAAGGEGLDLSSADVIHWYSHTFDLIERDQANERATQISGKAISVLDYVAPNTVDEHILENLKSKRDVSQELAGPGLRDRLLALFRMQA
jgi:SNF2 family DNA or RNA helicase